MIRVFISTWSLVGNELHNPVNDYIDTLPNVGIVTSIFYPDRDINGIPDKDRVLVMVEGPSIFDSPVNIEDIKNLTGVKMLPAYRFNKPISEIPANVKNNIKNAIINEGIPLSALSGIVVYGDFMKKVIKYFQAQFKNLGRYETTLEKDFE